MNSSVLLHPRNSAIFDTLVTKLPHGMLLSGALGMNLDEIALTIAVAHDKHPLVIDPDAGSISIEIIRELYTKLRVKQSKKQVIIIVRADRMTSEAQNAFLKLLEEPGEHISFLLTSARPNGLLPTIHSRLQSVQLTQTTKEQSLKQLVGYSEVTPTEKAQMLFMAQGLPQELARLAGDKDYFAQHVALIRSARSFLEGTTYAKLITVQELGNDRDKALAFLGALQRILKHSLQAKPSAATARRLDTVLITEEKLLANGHVRTQLLRVVFD